MAGNGPASSDHSVSMLFLVSGIVKWGPVDLAAATSFRVTKERARNIRMTNRPAKRSFRVFGTTHSQSTLEMSKRISREGSLSGSRERLVVACQDFGKARSLSGIGSLEARINNLRAITGL